MRICCISDLHGYFPPVPDCDLLLLAGDYAPAFKYRPFSYYQTRMEPWVKEAAEKCKVIGVAGNHDELFQQYPDLIPKMDWEYLQDSGTEFQGLKIYGSPWQPEFYDWAFNAKEEKLRDIWALIPVDTDILLLHGPPNGIGDHVVADDKHTGSPSLLERIQEIKPKLVVFGHIHDGYGRYDIDGTIFVNASHVNERYAPTREPIIVEL